MECWSRFSEQVSPKLQTRETEKCLSAVSADFCCVSTAAQADIELPTPRPPPWSWDVSHLCMHSHRTGVRHVISSCKPRRANAGIRLVFCQPEGPNTVTVVLIFLMMVTCLSIICIRFSVKCLVICWALSFLLLTSSCSLYITVIVSHLCCE